MIAAETLSVIDRLRGLGVRVGVFGRDVYIETSSDAMFRAIAKNYAASTSVVVSTVGRVAAADVAEYERSGYRFHMQGPSRRPTAFDWARHRREGA